MTTRIDKWLWAARFFKTRSLAKKHIEQGKIKINGQKCKASRNVEETDTITIRKQDLYWEVSVLMVSGKRGSAKIAQLMYQETAESLAKRTDLLALKKATFQSSPKSEKRPTKKQRRDIKQFKSNKH
ncbi:MAG: hypothetical protein L3J52_03175 [Proteobacteria bacterium]|nr:hypothetical protein [Pseudomonadota bacterium]